MRRFRGGDSVKDFCSCAICGGNKYLTKRTIRKHLEINGPMIVEEKKQILSVVEEDHAIPALDEDQKVPALDAEVGVFDEGGALDPSS